MRHIPALDVLKRRVGSDYRTRAEKLWSAAIESPGDLPNEVESMFKALARSVERLTETIRHSRVNGHHSTQELSKRLDSAYDGAVSALESIDPESFGRRSHFNTFERSRAELVHSAILLIHEQLERTLRGVEKISRDIHESLVEGPFQPEHPVNEQVLQPIA